MENFWYEKIFRPLLFLLNPETAHNISLKLFSVISRNFNISSIFEVESSVLKNNVFGLEFKNPIGIAAGFDKDADFIPAIVSLNPGFIEVGTVTPLPQDGNPKPRIFRLKKDYSLVNRMGFPSQGVGKLKKKLRNRPQKITLGINIGVNSTTPLQSLGHDYLICLEELYDYCDYFTVNISSPNTPILTKLHKSLNILNQIFTSLRYFVNAQKQKKPLLVKISPDLTDDEVEGIISTLKDKIDGVIATNTFPYNTSPLTSSSSFTLPSGGLSGALLKEKSNRIIKKVYQITNGKLPIIGCGGIMNAEDVYEKISLGASLVQVYTGLVYKGPFFIKRINHQLIKLLQKMGYKNIKDAIGKGGGHT